MYENTVLAGRDYLSGYEKIKAFQLTGIVNQFIMINKLKCVITVHF